MFLDLFTLIITLAFVISASVMVWAQLRFLRSYRKIVNPKEAITMEEAIRQRIAEKSFYGLFTKTISPDLGKVVRLYWKHYKNPQLEKEANVVRKLIYITIFIPVYGFLLSIAGELPFILEALIFNLPLLIVMIYVSKAWKAYHILYRKKINPDYPILPNETEEYLYQGFGGLLKIYSTPALSIQMFFERHKDKELNSAVKKVRLLYVSYLIVMLLEILLLIIFVILPQ